ncbi:MAG: PQQ-binding-like beta-propeller repeat protein, partial [Isosphaeraceae bacterium]|nr:PQQ-binding-like beta-propeller repeat protein [Isosphaeraceae bacterium]
ASGAQAQRPSAGGRTGAKFHPDASYTAESLLRNASAHVRDGQWAEAIEIYRRIIEQHGDTVALVPKDDPAADPAGETQLYVDARQCCQRRIAALPPEARALYRNRVDPQAEQWYRQGVTQRDRALLRRIVEEAFCSSWGDDALERLGDLAFQDGQFAEALAAYRQLVPDREGEALGLVHPDPSIDRAMVAAKKLLCRAALGEEPPSKAELEAFAQAYPDAKGKLAGREGPLAQIIAQAIRDDHLALPAQLDGRWPTFAGAPSRTRIAPGPVDVGSLQWRISLPTPIPTPTRTVDPFGRMRPSPNPTPEKLLAYHPIVLGDQVVLCDENRMIAYHLNARPDSEALILSADDPTLLAWDQKLVHSAAPTARSPQGTPRFTLSASGDRIFARLGSASVRTGAGATISTIIAVRNNREVEGKLLWRRAANEIALPKQQAGAAPLAIAFEGTPVADDRSVYVALSEGGMMTRTYVACLDAETGALRWVRYLGDANQAVDNNQVMGMGGMMGMALPAPEVGHRLLSLGGSMVYYQTNLGAVAALDAETGAVRWLATYPHREPGGGARERDLNPAILYDGLAIVAPEDSPYLYAFDAITGRRVWRSDREYPDVVHVLGVAKGRLIATGNHVYTLDVRTGKSLGVWPDSGPGYEGFGRGLLAGDQIYWPTRDKIYVLDQATGLESERGPIDLAQAFGTGGGNLAVGDGYLVVAGLDSDNRLSLTVYCQNSRLIQRYQQEIARNPEKAVNYYRLARVAEATDQDELALANLVEAARRAKPSETFDGQPLAEQALGDQYRLLMKLGAKAADAHDWPLAARRFAVAADTARTGKDRLTARLRLAEAQVKKGAPREAVGTLQGLLTDEAIRRLSVDVDAHRTVRADLLIADRLAEILQGPAGRALYADFDREAEALLRRGLQAGEPRLVAEVARSYPAARVVPDSLLALGELSLAKEPPSPSEAARAFKRLLAAAPSEAVRARALWGLGQAYERQRLWVPARDAYTRIQAKYPDVRLSDPAGPTLGSLAAERLAREPFVRMVGDRSEPNLPLPLARLWERRLEGPFRPVAADGVPPSADAARIFLARGTTLRPVHPSNGASAWTADLGGEPLWVGYLADRVLAATASRLMALSLETGSIEWKYNLGDPRPGRSDLNPFAQAPKAEPRREPEPDKDKEQEVGPLHDFRIVGNRVFCQRGDRELLAFDGDTGLIDWSYAPASGRLNPRLWIGPQRIVLQVLGKPNKLVILETDRGRAHEYPQPDRREAWVRAPLPIDDDHVALALDAQTIALFDLNRGIDAWTIKDAPVLPRVGLLRLFGDAGRLFVLFDGAELVRLDPANGARLWTRRLGPEDLSEWPEALAFDGDRVYCACGGRLAAYDLSDGSPAWERPLSGPRRGWAVTLTEGCVAAYPNPRRVADGDLEELPLVFCRRGDGALVQRLLFPAASEVAVRLAPQGTLVATQSGLWALGDRQATGDGAKRPR